MAEGQFIGTCDRCGKPGLVWKRTKSGYFILSEKGVQRHVCSKKNLQKMREMRKEKKQTIVSIHKCSLCGKKSKEIDEEDKNIIVKYFYKLCDECY